MDFTTLKIPDGHFAPARGGASAVGRTIRRFLLPGILALLAAVGCGKESQRNGRNVRVRLDGGTLLSRSESPDETRISDLNLFAFREDGEPEEQVWISARNFQEGGSFTLTLPKGLTYSLYACANFGYEIPGIRSRDELEAYRYYMAYPDEYSRGIPMTGIAELDGETDEVTISLERMMAKISLCIDRRGLEKDVRFNVRGVVIGHSPRSAAAFGTSRAQGDMDTFSRGFERTGTQADGLNRTRGETSEEVSVYMLENLQGEDPEIPSYIEIEAEYDSETRYTPPGRYLVYRFYLGSGPGNHDVQRNFHYRFTVRPEGDGLLTEDSWKVDKSALAHY